MAISTLSKIALRCPICGKLTYHDLSMFDFSGMKPRKFDCECGTVILDLGTKDKRHYWLQIECSFCEEKHVYYYHWKELWHDREEVLPLVCEESGMDAAYIGPEDMVVETVENEEKSLAEMADSLGFGDYFTSPEIMYGVLNRLNQLAERGSLFCQCGNYNVEIEIYPDRLELKCDLCGNSGIIMARDEKDLDKIKGLAEIQLMDKGFRCLEGEKKNPWKHF